MLDKSLIINNYTTSPSAAPGVGAIWNSPAFPAGKVNFNVGVRGRSEAINYYFWSNCTDYDPNMIYDASSMAAACGMNYQYNTSISTDSLYRDHNFAFTYATAGKYKPVILVERNGVWMHKVMDIELKPFVDLVVEYSDNNSFSPFASGGAGIYSPTDQTINSIGYDQYARLRWTTNGIPAGSKCTASKNWSGQKELNGVENLGQMKGGTYIYRLTCSYNGSDNYDELTLNIAPYVELNAAAGGFASVTSVNGQTIDLGTAASSVPLNSKITFNGFTKGADRCTLGSSPVGFLSGTTSVTPSNARTKVFNAVQSLGIDGTTSFTLRCSRTIGATTLSSMTTIRVLVSSGNCAFNGNNEIQAMTFCRNSIVTLSGASNVMLKGAFVARSFDIDQNSANVSFLYDHDSEGNMPPGFRFLNIPTPKEKGNVQN